MAEDRKGRDRSCEAPTIEVPMEKYSAAFMSYDYMLLRYSPPTSNSAVVI